MRVSGPHFHAFPLASHFHQICESRFGTYVVPGADGSRVEVAGAVTHIHAGFPCSVYGFHSESIEEMFESTTHSVSGS